MTTAKIIFISAFTLCTTISQAQLYNCIFDDPESMTADIKIESDALVNEYGDLSNTTKGYEVTSEILSEADLVKRHYFKNNLLVAQRNYTIDGALIGDESGVAIYEYVYDASGNVTKVMYFDENKTAVQAAFAGPAKIEYEYDNNGNRTKATYYDKYYNLLDLGVAIIEYIYDGSNNLTLEKRFNSERELVKETAPIIKYTYNDAGKVLHQLFLDVNNTAVTRLMENDEYDIAKITYEYDGDEVSMVYYYNIKGELLGSEKK